jgi:molybdenum cofactor biosynthesis protein B
MSSIDESRTFIPLNIAVLTISDTRSLEDDKSGSTLADRLVAAGHKLAAREIVTDDVEAIRLIVKRWIADTSVDAVITTGGTGFTGRDVTPEAIEPLLEKRMDGFSIAFHMMSHAKIGTSTIQSRATAGVAGATFIFCLPGSPGACRDGWDGIVQAWQYRQATMIRLRSTVREERPSCRKSHASERRPSGASPPSRS